MVLGIDTPLPTNIPVVFASRHLLFFFLRHTAVCWFVLAVAPRWKSVCNNIREVLRLSADHVCVCVCVREREQFLQDWVMRALSEIVDGAFYNLIKRSHTLLLVFHVSLCNQGYLLWFKIEFPISDYLRAHLPHLHKLCTALFFESRKASNAGTQE